MPDSSLPPFEGHDVTESTVQITKAGDGLSEALAVDPEAYHHDEEVFFVLRGVVTKIHHEPIKPGSDLLARKHTIVAQDVARVEPADVKALLDAQASRVQARKEELARREEEAAGIQRLTSVPEVGDDDGDG